MRSSYNYCWKNYLCRLFLGPGSDQGGWQWAYPVWQFSDRASHYSTGSSFFVSSGWNLQRKKQNWVWLTVTFPPPPRCYLTAQASTKRCGLVELGRLAKSIVEMKQSEKFTRQSIIHPFSNSLIPTKVRFQKYNRTSALWRQRKNKNVCRTDATDVPIKLFHPILQPGVLSWHQYDVSRNETGQTSSNDTMNNSQ